MKLQKEEKKRKERKMFDPDEATDFDRNDEELEEFMLFCFLNHGKGAKMQAQKLQVFLQIARDLGESPRPSLLRGDETPFELIRFLISRDKLGEATRKAKLGQYRVVDVGFKQIAQSKIDLRTCTPEELEEIKGIKYKSSRYFILHSREDQDYAVLDTHILKWLREIGHKEAPEQSPQSRKKYLEWEKIFFQECKDRNRNPANFDLEIWKSKRVSYHYDDHNHDCNLPWTY